MKNLSLIVALALFLLAGTVGAGSAEESKPFLADFHKEAGAECASCHGKTTKEVIPNENCFACHESYEKLAEQTSDMHLNPHNSPHYYDLECVACHQGHKSSTNFCQDCHGPISRQ